MGHQPETAGGVADVRRGVYSVGTNGNLHRRWAAAGAGDCHRQTGGWRPVIALFENSMARLRLDITPRITGPGLALHFSVRLLAGGVIKESLSMSEEKLGQHYLAALNEAFRRRAGPRQTKDQLTVTVKVNYLPEVVEFLYYKQGVGCRCCLVTTNAN